MTTEVTQVPHSLHLTVPYPCRMWAGYGSNTYQVWELADIDRERPTCFKRLIVRQIYMMQTLF